MKLLSNSPSPLVHLPLLDNLLSVYQLLDNSLESNADHRDPKFDSYTRELNCFDVGYLQNTTVVSNRKEEDLAEIWTSLCKGKNTMLWSDGLKQPASGLHLAIKD